MHKYWANKLILIFMIFSFQEARSEDFPLEASQACKDYITDLSKKIDGLKYGWIDVPENWFDQQNSKKIKIFYYTNIKPGMIPLAYFNGGPLSSSWRVLEELKKFTETRNLGLVMLDQRGTGCSSLIPTGRTEDILTRASYYSSDHIVRDSEMVRKYLFQDKKWKVFGQSYGVTIVSRYLMDFPESLISTHGYGGTAVTNFTDFYYQRLLAQSNILKTLELSYPGTVERLKKAKESLTDNDCIGSDTRKACGPVIVDALYLYLTGLPKALIETVINPFLKDDGTVNLIQAQKTLSFLLGFFYSDTYASNQALIRNEYISADNNNMDVTVDCRLAEEKILNIQKIDTEKMVTNECRLIKSIFSDLSVSGTKDILVNIPARHSINYDLVARNLRKNKGLKYYLYSGGMDGIAGFQAELDLSLKSKNIIFKLFPWLGHGGYRVEEKVWDDMLLN